jgi:Mrp family chromosome partitioning ATPase
MGSPVRLIAICSSTPGEGKSTLALNLAHSAAGAGLRTLVVDADLRRGTIGRLLDLPAHAPGFADILREGGNWRRGVHAVPGQNFSAMPCGSNPSSAIDLVVRRFPETLLAEARLEFDLVIIDCAPILAVSDAIPTLSRVDRVLFVVRLRSAMLSTITNALQVVRRSVKSTPLLVINRTRSSDGSQDHYDYPANAAHRPAR